jgi:hypothetical protein
MQIPGCHVDRCERDQVRARAGAVEARIDLAPERGRRRQRLSVDEARDLLLAALNATPP